MVEATRAGYTPQDAKWVRAMERTGLSEQTIDEVVAKTEPNPEDLATVNEAAKEFALSASTIHTWIHANHLSRHGFRHTEAGRPALLVDKTEVATLKANPPKNGRPRKTNFHSKLEDLVTLDAASADTDLKVERIYGWTKRGILAIHARKRSPAPGGGMILVDINEVRALKDNPPKNGRPRKTNFHYGITLIHN